MFINLFYDLVGLDIIEDGGVQMNEIIISFLNGLASGLGIAAVVTITYYFYKKEAKAREDRIQENVIKYLEGKKE